MRNTSAASAPEQRSGVAPGHGHGHHDGDADGDSPHSPRAHRILLQHLHRPSTRVDQTGQ